MLQISKLSKSYGKAVALDQISCNLGKGIYGLLGPNGAGKTTFFRCLSGIIEQDSGSITPVHQVGYLPQHFGFYKGMKVKELMLLFYDLKKIPCRESHDEMLQLMEKVQLLDRMHDKVGSLSGGMLRRLGIALALQGNPELLLIDEPTAGLDPEQRLIFKNIIRSLRGDRTIIVSTHIVEDVEALCDQIIIMNKGRILTLGTEIEITQRAQGKVYEILESQQDTLIKPYHIIKNSQQKGQSFLRVLSDTQQRIEPTEQTIEDAYLLYIWNERKNAESN